MVQGAGETAPGRVSIPTHSERGLIVSGGILWNRWPGGGELSVPTHMQPEDNDRTGQSAGSRQFCEISRRKKTNMIIMLNKVYRGKGLT